MNDEQPTSKSVGVTCGMCNQELGDQFKPGDGAELFRAHLEVAHPREAKAVRATETAVIRIPWPPRQPKVEADG